jgi:hypothetical protein
VAKDGSRKRKKSMLSLLIDVYLYPPHKSIMDFFIVRSIKEKIAGQALLD